MDLNSIKSAYRRYARLYDALFGAIFAGGRRMAVHLVNDQPGQRILEVGVGTGLSLPGYRSDARVVGIDISPEMLREARQRVSRQRLPQVEGLLEMDAERLGFSDNSFDAVVAMYVASVVPHPELLLSEMQRVCKSGGQIVLINHFASSHPLLRVFERGLRPLSRLLGFRTDMSLDSLPQLPGLTRVAVLRANLFGYWKLVHYRNESQVLVAAGGQPRTAVLDLAD